MNGSVQNLQVAQHLPLPMLSQKPTIRSSDSSIVFGGGDWLASLTTTTATFPPRLKSCAACAACVGFKAGGGYGDPAVLLHEHAANGAK
jgi:hypothetical protein